MVSCGTTTSTSLAITGLASGTTYAMTVKAKDAAGNVSAASTTLNVTTTKYTLTVTGGTGGGTYKDGTVVAIAANAPATGKVFDKWTGDVTNVANVNAASTTITMSAAKTVVVATYKDIPVATYTVTFMITDGTKTVSGASVTYNSETKTTDASGQVIFTNVPQASNLTYAITAPGFKPTTVSINVVNNITKQVVLQTDALDTEKSIDEIRVYPNPATDYIKILTTNRAGGTVSVVNCSGVTIIKEKIVSEETLINVSGWTKGLYLMIVSGSEYTVEKQFIVQ